MAEIVRIGLETLLALEAENTSDAEGTEYLLEGVKVSRYTIIDEPEGGREGSVRGEITVSDRDRTLEVVRETISYPEAKLLGNQLGDAVFFRDNVQVEGTYDSQKGVFYATEISLAQPNQN